MNSYQKLKKKNADLQKQYNELFSKFYKYLKDPTSYESTMIASEIEMQGRLSEMYMFGQKNGYSMLGILEQVSKLEKNNDNTFNWNINK